MLPLVPIALSLAPDLIRLLAGDKAGALATQVAEAVKTVTQAEDPAAARAALAADAGREADLKARLATIALEAARIQAQEEEARRAAEQAALLAATQDRADARATFGALAREGHGLAWAPPVTSVVVTVGFFAVVLLLILRPEPLREADGVFQIVNLTVGALGAAFATVVNFWLGSSQGSRLKDEAQWRTGRAAPRPAAVPPAPSADDHRPEAPPAAPKTAPGTAPARMAGDRFDACIGPVLAQEGGYVNDPADPGGATRYGITLATLKEWLGQDDLTAEDVKALPLETAREIYRSRYWNPLRCSDLPVGVDLVVFDIGVNAGPRRAARFLQQACGAAVDGSIGPATLAAARATSPWALVDRLCDLRLDHYRGLPTFDRFGRGWTRRTREIRDAALAAIG